MASKDVAVTEPDTVKFPDNDEIDILPDMVPVTVKLPGILTVSLDVPNTIWLSSVIVALYPNAVEYE